MKKVLVVIILMLVAFVAANIARYNSIKEKYEASEMNVKSYSQLLSKSEQKNTAYKLTVEQLEYFNDSIFQKLNRTRDSLKIKNKNLQSLHYIQSEFTKIDTIVLKDTLYKDVDTTVDTVFGDPWYHMRLALIYPSTIIVEPSFRSEKQVIISSKKETINPPKKFFLFRWFQKKHQVIQVDVVESNPYIENEKSRYVEIIK